jgi:hypothetical protein
MQNIQIGASVAGEQLQAPPTQNSVTARLASDRRRQFKYEAWARRRVGSRMSPAANPPVAARRGRWQAPPRSVIGRARPDRAEGDTDDMNRERAETHLRLLAEEELRRAMTRLRDGAAGSQPDDAAVRSASVTGTVAGGAAPGSSLRQVPPGVPDERRARVARVARALTAVAALDDEVAAQILADFELALATRQAGSQGRRGPGLGSWIGSPRRRRRPARN